MRRWRPGWRRWPQRCARCTSSIVRRAARRRRCFRIAGASGNSFNTSDKRAVLCGPQQLFLDSGIVPTGIGVDPIAGKAIQTIANLTHAGPLSPWVAGATSAKDLAQGYWWSPSNTQIIGVLGPDVSVYSSFIDSASDTNVLNSQGILTAFQAFGTGIRVWGNRSAGFPSYTTPDVFIPIRRTMDVIEQSVMLSMMQFLDQPISNALISTILASVNSFIRVLIGRGALVAGSRDATTRQRIRRAKSPRGSWCSISIACRRRRPSG